MTYEHAAWPYLVALLEQLEPALNSGKISRTQRARMKEMFDRITASTVLYLTKSDMAEIGKVLIELGENQGVKARSVKHG